jgi:adenylate cyclase class 2
MASVLPFQRLGAGLGKRSISMIEIEKKYRLSKQQREAVLRRLPQIGARPRGEEFEENTLYDGESLDLTRSVLRLRRVGKTGTLTYKEGSTTSSSIRHQREDETRVEDPEAMEAILDALGFRPILVYEKRRETWRFGKTEIVVDELPFGLFMEIEGSDADIAAAELKLGIKGLRAERQTYPQLARKHGKRYGDMIEARFDE